MATRWRRWSRYGRPLLTVGGVALLGLAAEWQRWRFGGDLAVWVPDLAVGVGLAIAGALVSTVDPRSRVGDIVALAGAAWFLPDVLGIGGASLAWLAAHTIVLHRAILFQAIMTFPTGRSARSFEVVVVAVAYVTSLADLSRDEAGQIAWAIGAMVAFIAIVVRRRGSSRDAGIHVLPTMALLCLVVGGTGVLLLSFGNAPPSPAIIHAYEAGLVAVGFALLLNVVDHRDRLHADDRRGRRAHPRSSGLCPGTPCDCQRDPSVEVAFAVDDDGSTAWVDEPGRSIEPLSGTGSRAVVPVLVDGRAVAQIACESVAIDEPGLISSIEAAARLAAKNAQLRGSLRSEAAALEASRLRLMFAADNERTSLADGWIEERVRRSISFAP